MEDIAKILPVLRQFGISPEMLGPERLEKLMSLADKIQNPSEITQDTSRQIMNILGISTRNIIKKDDIQKIGRNDQCPCGKIGKKYKKCCGKVEVNSK